MGRGTPKWVHERIPHHLGPRCRSAVRKQLMKEYYENQKREPLDTDKQPLILVSKE